MIATEDSLTGEFRKILLICFGGIGDVILFFPVVKTLGDLYPNSEISILVEPRCHNIASEHPLIKETFTFDLKNKPKIKEYIDIVNSLRRKNFDLAISMGSSFMVPILLFLTGAKHRVGYETNKLKFLLSKSAPLNKEQYAAKMYFDLLKGVAIDTDILRPIPEIDIPTESLEWVDKLFDEHKIKKDEEQKMIVVHPGVSKLSKKKKIIKNWEANKWSQLIDKLLLNNIKVLLCGGPDDEEDINFIRKHVTAPKEHFHDLFGETKSLQQFGAIVQKADLLVCVDSAPMHIGVGVNKPLVALFGPTNEKKVLPPENEKFTPVRIELDCAPCLWETRKKTCEELNCMRQLELNKVFDTILHQLGITSGIKC